MRRVLGADAMRARAGSEYPLPVASEFRNAARSDSRKEDRISGHDPSRRAFSCAHPVLPSWPTVDYSRTRDPRRSRANSNGAGSQALAGSGTGTAANEKQVT